MTATEILDRFKELGVSVHLYGDKVRVAPVSLVPVDLMTEAKAHKAEIVHELQTTYGDGLRPPLDRPPADETEFRRWMDYTADPENFDRWLAWKDSKEFLEWLDWAMTYRDPTEGN